MPEIPPSQTPDALLLEMLESARLVRDYVAGMSFDDFRETAHDDIPPPIAARENHFANQQPPPAPQSEG